MTAQATEATAPTPRSTGVEHWTTRQPRRRRPPVPVGEVRRHAGGQAGGAVRARLVDGVAADVRPHGARPAGLVGDGLVRAPRLRLLVRRHGRLRPLRQEARHLLRHRQRRRRSRRGDRLHRKHARRPRVHDLRHLVGRAARRAVRRSAIRSASRGSRSTRSSGPAKARRRSSSGARSCRSSSRRSAGRSIARSSIRSSSATIPTAPSKRVVDAFADAILALDDSMPNGTYIDMCSKLPVVDPAQITVPTMVMRGQYDGIAALRRPDRVLQAAAESRQAVHDDGRHLARELPAEELPDGLPHPARVVHAAGSGLCRTGARCAIGTAAQVRA